MRFWKSAHGRAIRVAGAATSIRAGSRHGLWCTISGLSAEPEFPMITRSPAEFVQQARLGLTAMAMALLLPFTALAQTPAGNATLVGSAEAGANKTAVCAACHGVDGNSVNPDWPSLAGQNAAYLREQLSLFISSKRVNDLMYPMVSDLAPQDVADIAAYYATLTPTGLEADPSYWQAGEALYRAGDAKRGIPACAACHGPVGAGNPANGYPAIRAQHSVYASNQLQAYANGTRYQDATDPENVKQYQSRNGQMMATIAARLTAEDIRNLASYMQGLR